MPPLVVATRAMPGPFVVPGATIKVLSKRLLSRAAVLRGIRGASGIATMFTDRVDAEFLDAAGENLRIVAHYAQGHDTIDLAACRARRVQVSVTPDVVTEGTADMAWALLLAVARRVVEADAFARSGAYERNGQLSMCDLLGTDLAGKTLVIVGAGRIGLGVAMRSIGWRMRVLYVARSKHPEFEQAPLFAKRVTLDKGLQAADVVSVHTPLTIQTKHLLNKRRLAMLSPQAIVINTSRGPVIDETALAARLKAGKLLGAGLDVFEHEPRVHPTLKQLRNVVLSPHIGSAATRYRHEQTAMVALNIVAGLAGKLAPNALPTNT
jgi:glyoxylate reductase